MNKNIEIIQPDDWHVHFREGDMLEMVTNFSSRINKRCVAMPNTEIPITDTNKASSYKELLEKASNNNFMPSSGSMCPSSLAVIIKLAA